MPSFGVKGCEGELRETLRSFKFATVAEVLSQVKSWPEYELEGGDIRRAGESASPSAGNRAA